jgi:hypothetical protein
MQGEKNGIAKENVQKEAGIELDKEMREEEYEAEEMGKSDLTRDHERKG